MTLGLCLSFFKRGRSFTLKKSFKIIEQVLKCLFLYHFNLKTNVVYVASVKLYFHCNAKIAIVNIKY